MASSSSTTRGMVRRGWSGLIERGGCSAARRHPPPSLTHTQPTHTHAHTEEGNPPGGEEPGAPAQQQQQQEGAPDAMIRPYFEVPWYRTHHLQQQVRRISPSCVSAHIVHLHLRPTHAHPYPTQSNPPPNAKQKGKAGAAAPKQAQHQAAYPRLPPLLRLHNELLDFCDLLAPTRAELQDRQRVAKISADTVRGVPVCVLYMCVVGVAVLLFCRPADVLCMARRRPRARIRTTGEAAVARVRRAGLRVGGHQGANRSRACMHPTHVYTHSAFHLHHLTVKRTAPHPSHRCSSPRATSTWWSSRPGSCPCTRSAPTSTSSPTYVRLLAPCVCIFGQVGGRAQSVVCVRSNGHRPSDSGSFHATLHNRPPTRPTRPSRATRR